MNTFDDPNYIGTSSWKNCKIGRWNLSYDFITSNIALGKLFKKSSQLSAEIEPPEPFINPLKIPLEEDNEEAVERGDNKAVPIELSTLIVTKIDGGGLPAGYKFVDNRTLVTSYNKTLTRNKLVQSSLFVNL